MSERRLVGLIRNLPPESSTVRALTGADPGTEWSQTDYLLASALDALNTLAWTTIKANSEDFDEPAPEPVYRPVQPPRPDIPETPLSEMAAWIGQIGRMPDGG